MPGCLNVSLSHATSSIPGSSVSSSNAFYCRFLVVCLLEEHPRDPLCGSFVPLLSPDEPGPALALCSANSWAGGWLGGMSLPTTRDSGQCFSSPPHSSLKLQSREPGGKTQRVITGLILPLLRCSDTQRCRYPRHTEELGKLSGCVGKG